MRRKRFEIDLRQFLVELVETYSFDLPSVARLASMFPGDHSSVRIGTRGYEFHDIKLYEPFRDPISGIDTNLSRRLGKIVVRLFLQEREMPIFLIADASETMLWAEKPLLLLKSIAILGSYVAEKMNAVGSVCLGSSTSFEKSRHDKSSIWSLLKAVCGEIGSRTATENWDSFGTLVNKIDEPSLLFLFSDFLADESLISSALAKMRIHEIVPVVIHSYHEHVLPKSPEGSFADLVTGMESMIDSDDETLQVRYRAALEYFETNLAKLFVRLGVKRALHVMGPGFTAEDDFLSKSFR